MATPTKSSFESTISALVLAKARNSSKGKPMIDWFNESFGYQARVAHITEDKQLGNRVKEQFSYEVPIVVFLCEPAVSIDGLMRFVCQQAYANLNNILVISNKALHTYEYVHLYSNTDNDFVLWAETELGITKEDAVWSSASQTAHTLEPSIANFITQHDNETHTFDDLVKIYSDVYSKSEYGKRVPDTDFFGIFYAPHIAALGKGAGSSIASAALGADEGSMGDEIYRGVKLGLELRKHLNVSHVSCTTGTSSSAEDYDRFLRALRTKPFLLLAGISGTGKSRIVRELAFKSCPGSLQDTDGTTPGNYLMVEVKPNWHDSTELRGYYSNIAKGYQPTDFILFAAKAAENPDVPFFVCLDEMNLAPVEQYFAEFLSVLETRKKIGDHIISGELLSASDMDNLKAQEKLKDVDVLKNWPSRKALTLPDNLFVIGTVNMDDTTHQFSRKVIDRAMTIEMNGGDLSDMFGRSHDLEYLPASDVWGLNSFAPEYVTADEALDKHPAEAEQMKKELTERLQAINNVLENTPFQVSYRVLNELCIYTAVLLDDGFAIDEAIEEAVDQIALMKILPRIEGDEDMFSIRNENVNKLDKLKDLFDPGSDSWKKLDEMNKRLGNGGGFTRFWP